MKQKSIWNIIWNIKLYAKNRKELKKGIIRKSLGHQMQVFVGGSCLNKFSILKVNFIAFFGHCIQIINSHNLKLSLGSHDSSEYLQNCAGLDPYFSGKTNKRTPRC